VALDRATIEAADPSGQLAEVLDLPTHLRDALWRVTPAGLAPRQSAGLVVAGMGGSGIGGLLARGTLGGRETAPVLCVREAGLPAWVDETWSVLLSSYSGSTEETLACWDAATERGCHRIACTTAAAGDRAREAASPSSRARRASSPRAVRLQRRRRARGRRRGRRRAVAARRGGGRARPARRPWWPSGGPDAPEDARVQGGSPRRSTAASPSSSAAASPGGRVPLEVPGQRERQPARLRLPSCRRPTTTRSRRGATRAVRAGLPRGPARRRAPARRFELTADVIGGATGVARAAARRRPSACSPSCCSATSCRSTSPCSPGVDPRGGPGDRALQRAAVAARAASPPYVMAPGASAAPCGRPLPRSGSGTSGPACLAYALLSLGEPVEVVGRRQGRGSAAVDAPVVAPNSRSAPGLARRASRAALRRCLLSLPSACPWSLLRSAGCPSDAAPRTRWSRLRLAFGEQPGRSSR
jgi:D-arabinose 5-phosphate isomerase GutQ